MLDTLHTCWKDLCEKGIRLPFAYDPEANKPSVTLMFYWVTAALSVISLILFHIGLVTIQSTAMSLAFVFMSFIMYRLRKLDSVKIDLKNDSVELDDNNQKENK